MTERKRARTDGKRPGRDAQSKVPDGAAQQEADALVRMTSALIGSEANAGERAVTATVDDSFGLLLYKAGRLKHVGFEQGKGNLFEYIENAKLETNLARAGRPNAGKHFVMDAPASQGGYNDPHGAADFRIAHRDGTADLAQAKYNNDAHRAALNFADPKYHGMERIAPSDQVAAVREQLDAMVAKGEISRAAYEDAVSHLETDGLRDSATGITSGGTTTAEVEQFRGAGGKVSARKVRQYVEDVQRQQYVQEVQGQALRSAASAAVMTGVVSAVRNVAAVLDDRKRLDEAMKDIGATTAKATVRGGATGALSATIRVGAKTNGLPVLADATAATVLAASLLDVGVSIFDYARGEIDGRQLAQNIGDTAAKGVTTVYLSKAIAATVGATSVIVPIAIFTIAQYGLMSIRSIVAHAKLNAAEHRRMAALYRETEATMQRYRADMEQRMATYTAHQAAVMQAVLQGLRPGADGRMDYGRAVASLVCFANQTGLALQHADRDAFCEAMQSDDDFCLE